MGDFTRPDEAPKAVRENIEAVLRLESAAMRRRTAADRAADAIADFTGTIPFVMLHLLFFGFWVTVNLRLLPILPAFDPYPFQLLCMIVSMEGVLLATFVLIKQNRMGYLNNRREHIDLQINMLTEREVTRTLQLAEAMAERMGISPKRGVTELAEETSVEELAQALDRGLKAEE